MKTRDLGCLAAAVARLTAAKAAVRAAVAVVVVVVDIAPLPAAAAAVTTESTIEVKATFAVIAQMVARTRPVGWR
jgi:hypothetical protein